MPTITPNNTINLALSVKDRAASAAWFKKHLGFEEIVSVDEAGWTEEVRRMAQQGQACRSELREMAQAIA